MKNYNSNHEEYIDVIIIINNENPRVDDLISLSIDDNNDGNNYTWILSIQEIKYGRNVNIMFNKSDYFNIQAYVEYDNAIGYNEIIIEVKNNDIITKIDRGIPIRAGPLINQNGIQDRYVLFNGTTTPIVRVKYEIISGIGNVGSEIWMSTDTEFEILCSEEASIFNEGITFYFELYEEDLIKFDMPYDIVINLFVYDGFITGFIYDFEMIY